MPKAIVYGRQSHRQAMEHVNPENGNAEGLEAQEESGRRYWLCYLEKDGVTFGGFVPDKAVSARSKAFADRPGGKLVLSVLEPGDHLIFDKIDRIWRDIEDFVDLSRLLAARGVTWHICNLLGVSVRRGTSMGDFLINLFVSIAQLESDRTSERMKDMRAHLRRNGRYAGDRPLIGTKAIRKPVKRADGSVRNRIVDVVYDEDLRKVMALIVKMHDQEGASYYKIWALLNTRLQKEFGWEFARDRMKIHSAHKVELLYIREKQFQALGNPDPKMICLTQQFGGANRLPKEK